MIHGTMNVKKNIHRLFVPDVVGPVYKDVFPDILEYDWDINSNPFYK